MGMHSELHRFREFEEELQGELQSLVNHLGVISSYPQGYDHGLVQQTTNLAYDLIDKLTELRRSTYSWR